MTGATGSNTTPTTAARRPVAVIDLGASAIRMEVAEIDEQGHVHSLETLQHPVNLGKDTFNAGQIEQDTIEECVSVLKGYRRVLLDYGIDRPDHIRAVATSSVREASNRQTFLNRLFIASQIRVEAIEESEVNRLTYIAVRDGLERWGGLDAHDTLIVEVGGGSTEVLLVQDKHVTLSRTYRLGALRMRETLETSRTPAGRMASILGRHIQRTVDQIHRTIPPEPVQRMIALGGDVRVAADELVPERSDERLVSIPLKRFYQFARQVAAMPVDELARNYHLGFQDAETLGPALLAYAQLADSFDVQELLISKITLRDGLLLEMATRGMWTDHFRNQIIHSSKQLGEKYSYEDKHAHHVAKLCGALFHELQDEHELDPRYELLLHVAALLHEIGLYVGNQSHHKHSQYLITNSDLFGLSRKDTLMVALIARYHRRAIPKPSHVEYAALPESDQLIVAKLAALLRIADALDQNHMQQIRDIQFQRNGRQLMIRVHGVEDLTLERFALRDKGQLFRDIFGLTVEIRRDARVRGIHHVR